MTHWMGALVLCAAVWLHARMDAVVWGSRLTPGVVLAAGYAVAALVYAAADLVYQTSPLGGPTYAFLFVATLCSTGISLVVGLALPRSRAATLRTVPSGGGPKWVVLGVALLYIGLALRGMGDAALLSSDSRDAIGGGVTGHLHNLLAIVGIWYAAVANDGRWVRVPLLVLVLGALLLYPVKGWVLIPLFAMVMVGPLCGRRLAGSPPMLVLSGAAGVVVFFAIYAVRADAWGADADVLVATLTEILRHFVFYLTAGLAGLGAVVERGLMLPGGADTLVAPFYNVAAALLGEDYKNIIGQVHVTVIAEHESEGNVFTFLGTLIAYAGWWGGGAFAVLLLLASYAFYAVAMATPSVWFRVGLAYLLAVYAFGWFEYYFWHLIVYEAILLAVAFGALDLLFQLARPTGRVDRCWLP